MTALSGDFANTRELLEAAAVVYGDREAYVEPGSRISFAEWASRSRRVAAGLVARGVGKGDVVALRLPSGIDYATCYAAAATIGAITTGINPRLGPREVGAILEQTEPALVISEPAELRRLYDEGGDRFPGVPDVEIDGHDPVALIFSSGTTGLPKGAVFDGNNLLAGAVSAGVMSAPYDRRLTSTPFAHAGYMFKLWDQLLWGTTLVIPPTPWSAAGMATALHEERITVAGAVPTQWAKLLEVSPAMFPHLRVGVVATAPASPELVRAVADRIGVPLVVRYAMTECPTICGTEPEDAPDIQFRTVGRPAPGMAVRLSGDGVVEVRGPCVMRGYWRNPELTAEVLRDGWLRTGDLGVVHDDGTLSLIGRRDDMYIRGGFNVHPVEVEQVIATHPAVSRAVVVGCPAPVIGEIGVVFVVPKDASAPPSLPELRTHVHTQLADYKAPDQLIVVDDIPLTAMFKPDRSALRSLAAANVRGHGT
ncbi:UNVERIFIED_CONTAM: acyl--CoA ligase [Mycobacterium avium subsp. hominissuis]